MKTQIEKITSVINTRMHDGCLYFNIRTNKNNYYYEYSNNNSKSIVDFVRDFYDNKGLRSVYSRMTKNLSDCEILAWALSGLTITVVYEDSIAIVDRKETTLLWNTLTMPDDKEKELNKLQDKLQEKALEHLFNFLL